jgi:uncharacterized protein (DUF2235 family)
MDMATDIPTNIVLLSDGTGNGAASPFKTNVWRMYQAIDIKPPAAASDRRQIVYYDDGVGTENFKPLAALGGAFGFGVWKNVKDLYTFVCRNYQVGDQVFGFGFSRGAFTIRLLMGMIGKCGIVKTKPHSEAKLRDAIDMAYEAFRRDFLLRASRQRGLIYHLVLRSPRHIVSDRPWESVRLDLTNGKDDAIVQFFIDVPFLGVWDTVDAYGMPVDELKIAIDRWAWPMSFADRYPTSNIKAIRHALSLDDERPTFRPVLWSERLPNPANPTSPERRTLTRERMQQVWFSGVHANVGGGYPDDGLAYATLDWMMAEAESHGLRFYGPPRAEAAARVDPHGEEYDSRAGIAGYYRYGPRNVAQLCDDKQHLVEVPVPWVHVDAFDRVSRHQRAYAPVSLNTQFQVTGGDPAQYPPAAMMAPDSECIELAWDIVWWRRIAYFATLLTTAFVALFFAALMYQWPNRILDCAERALAGLFGAAVEGWLTGVIGKAGSRFASLLPGWLGAVLPELSKYPLAAVVSLALLAVLFFRVADVLQARIGMFAEWAWAAQKGLPATGAPEPNWLNAIARPGRKLSAMLYRFVWIGIIVNIAGFAIGLVTAIILLPIMKLRDLRRRPWMA